MHKSVLKIGGAVYRVDYLNTEDILATTSGKTLIRLGFFLIGRADLLWFDKTFADREAG